MSKIFQKLKLVKKIEANYQNFHKNLQTREKNKKIKIIPEDKCVYALWVL